MLMSRYQNLEQNQNIKMFKRSFENVAKFRYLGMIVTNRNLIREEIKVILLPFTSESFVFSSAV
jgi:hypothetical protein